MGEYPYAGPRATKVYSSAHCAISMPVKDPPFCAGVGLLTVDPGLPLMGHPSDADQEAITGPSGPESAFHTCHPHPASAIRGCSSLSRAPRGCFPPREVRRAAL